MPKVRYFSTDVATHQILALRKSDTLVPKVRYFSTSAAGAAYMRPVKISNFRLQRKNLVRNDIGFRY